MTAMPSSELVGKHHSSTSTEYVSTMTPPAKKTHSESTYFLRSSTKNQGTRQQKDPLVHSHKLAPIQETGQGEHTLVDHKQFEKLKNLMEDECVDGNFPNTGTDSAII
jgi:hypothetical protein